MTIKKKDWDDFWYNSEQIYPPETKHNYNELVDYQVHSMNRFESLSDTMNETETNNQEYQDYKDQVKQYQLNTNGNLTEMILQIGFKIDQSLDRIIKQLDTVLKDEL